MGGNSKSPWVVRLFFLVLTLGLCCVPAVSGAEEKKKTDLAAEAKQEAEEDAEELKQRALGKIKLRRTFRGTFHRLDESENDNPEVIGAFFTDNSEIGPGQLYSVRVEGTNKALVIETFKKLDGKKAIIHGRLRLAKYLIVTNVIEIGPTPPPRDRFKGGGL